VGWGTLRDRFLARMAGSASLVLLLDAGYPSSLEGVAADLGLARVDCGEHAAACAAAARVDGGYQLYTAAPAESAHARQPVVVLLSKAAFPPPLWVQRNGSAEAAIAAGWSTPHCVATPYLKTKFLNWCAARKSCDCMHTAAPNRCRKVVAPMACKAATSSTSRRASPSRQCRRCRGIGAIISVVRQRR
jgi:hypothetical protein